MYSIPLTFCGLDEDDIWGLVLDDQPLHWGMPMPQLRAELRFRLLATLYFINKNNIFCSGIPPSPKQLEDMADAHLYLDDTFCNKPAVPDWNRLAAQAAPLVGKLNSYVRRDACPDAYTPTCIASEDYLHLLEEMDESIFPDPVVNPSVASTASLPALPLVCLAICAIISSIRW